MLFDASTTYAPGEPHGDVGYSNYQNMNVLGRWNIPQAVKSPNLLIGAAALIGVIWLCHKGLGGKK